MQYRSVCSGRGRSGLGIVAFRGSAMAWPGADARLNAAHCGLLGMLSLSLTALKSFQQLFAEDAMSGRLSATVVSATQPLGSAQDLA